MNPFLRWRQRSLAAALACGLMGGPLAAAPARAQDEAATRFEALARAAVATAPSVQGKRRELDAAGHALEAARWGRFPSLSVSVSSHAAATGGAPVGSGPGSTVRLEQTLYAWGGIDGRIRAAEQQRDIARLAVQTEANAVLDRLIAAFSQFQQAQERLKIQRAALARLHDYQAMIARRLATQISSRNDEALVTARVGQARADIAASQAALLRARAQLEELTTLGVDAVQPVAAEAGADRAAAQDAESAALAASPELASARLQAQAAETEIELRRTDYKPRVVARLERVRSPSSVGGSVNYSQVYVALEATLNNGLSQFDVVRQSISRKEAIEQQIDAMQRGLRQQCQALAADAQAIASQLPALDEVGRRNGEVVDSFMRQYVAGRKSWLDVLNSERELTQSRLNLSDLRAQSGATALRLQRLAGRLLPPEESQAGDSAEVPRSVPAEGASTPAGSR